jgi:L-cysteine:1D-myo-inositol 2-amino-2-deoxy-alpha-D-glucopyranoside ligase
MLPVANERGNRPDDPHKRDPLDFVLWQAQAPGEPSWDSPWGPGRPGWHIECSTMAGKFLGQTVDVHAGGGDLIFPHHESEIAQAEPLSGRPFVRFWMHVAMVELEGQKMSKSLGNLIMVRDLLRRWSPDALRLYLAVHHYRSAWGYSEEELGAAQVRADFLKRAAEFEGSSRQRAGAPGSPQLEPLGPEAAQAAFERAMDSDLDASAALAALEGLATHILDSSSGGAGAEQGRHVLRRLASVLGLRLGSEPAPGVTQGWTEHLTRFEGPSLQESPVGGGL